MTPKSATRPKATDNRTYHLHTRPGDLAPLCLLVGAPERAEMIAKMFFKKATLMGDHRGLKSYTGTYEKNLVSVVTTGMGTPSTGIVLPEAYESGARTFIRVGSCSTLLKDPKPGDVIIVSAAVRFDGASRNWAPIEYPAAAHYRVVSALEKAADGLVSKSGRFYVGVEATTDCFNQGQARPDLKGRVPERLRRQHKELIELGVACYSMEAAALFVWCGINGLPAGAINAVYGNRHTNKFKVAGEELAAKIALKALAIFADDPGMAKFALKSP